MKYLVTADFANGSVPRWEQGFDEAEAAKRAADMWFSDPAFKNVEIKEPFGVIVTYKSRKRKVEYCETYALALDGAASMQRVIDNREVNGHPAVQVEAIGFRSRAVQATAEDIILGAWLSAALSDPSTCPSMKYDINLWFDSKEWP